MNNLIILKIKMNREELIIKQGLAQILKGGVIMDFVNVEEAIICRESRYSCCYGIRKSSIRYKKRVENCNEIKNQNL